MQQVHDKSVEAVKALQFHPLTIEQRGQSSELEREGCLGQLIRLCVAVCWLMSLGMAGLAAALLGLSAWLGEDCACNIGQLYP